MSVPYPENEAARVEALKAFQLLDTPNEKQFDDIVKLASEICETPIALMTLLDADRQWYKSKIGMENSETAREHAFCSYAIMTPEQVMVVPDAEKDPRFSRNPFVIDKPSIRFYAGAPLVTTHGEALGTLCVLDQVPRKPTTKMLYCIQVLADRIMSELELRKKNMLLQMSQTYLSTVMETIAEGVIIRDVKGKVIGFNKSARQILGSTLDDMMGNVDFEPIFQPIKEDGTLMQVEEMPSIVTLKTGIPQTNTVFGSVMKDGRTLWLESNTALLKSGETLAGVVVSFRDISQRRALDEQLRKDSTLDPLTKLFNRRAFFEHMNQLIESSTRCYHSLSLCLCNIDHFKQVNDKFGHTTGDQALSQFADLIRLQTRSEDIAARIGGDEFAILFPDISADNMRKELERLRTAWQVECIQTPQEEPVKMSASFGLVDWHPGMASTALMESAEKALQHAKAIG